LFRSMPIGTAALTAVGFLALVGLWCALGALLGTHRAVVATLGRIHHWLVPLVLIAVGVLILITTGALSLITDALYFCVPYFRSRSQCVMVALRLRPHMRAHSVS